MIDVTLDQLIEMSYKLDGIKDGVPRATVSTINKTAQGVRTDMVRSAVKHYIVKASAVRKTIKIHRAKKGGEYITSDVISIGTRIPLDQFKVRPKRVQRKGRNNKPIFVQVRREGGGAYLNKAFLVQSAKSGKPIIMERKTARRYPLELKFGPAIPSMLKNQDILDFIQESGSDRFERNLEHEIHRILGGFGK